MKYTIITFSCLLLVLLAFMLSQQQTKTIHIKGTAEEVKRDIAGSSWTISHKKGKSILEVKVGDKLIFSREAERLRFPHFSDLKGQDLNATDKIFPNGHTVIIEELQQGEFFVYHFFLMNEKLHQIGSFHTGPNTINLFRDNDGHWHLQIYDATLSGWLSNDEGRPAIPVLLNYDPAIKAFVISKQEMMQRQFSKGETQRAIAACREVALRGHPRALEFLCEEMLKRLYAGKQEAAMAFLDQAWVGDVKLDSHLHHLIPVSLRRRFGKEWQLQHLLPESLQISSFKKKKKKTAKPQIRIGPKWTKASFKKAFFERLERSPWWRELRFQPEDTKVPDPIRLEVNPK